MKELFEVVEITEKLIEEKKNKNIIGRFSVPFAVGDKENKNKRTYPSEILKREINKLNQQNIKLAGNLEHPSDGITRIDKTSHFIEKLYWDDEAKKAWMTCSILNTTAGNDLNCQLNAGLKVGVSMRGFGNCKDGVIQDDYQLSSVDVVSAPSFGKSVELSQIHLHESLNSVLFKKEKDMKNQLIGRFKEAILAGYQGTFAEYQKAFPLDEN